jgi:hypothetical protein
MGLPPTTSKFSGDTSNITTFFYDFPNFTGTHSGVTATLGTLAVGGGGTGDTTLTANNFLVGAGTSPVTFFAPGASGTVVSSNGFNFINTNFAGSAAFSIFASSAVTNTSSFITSSTFTTFSNSPAFTFTPTITGTYKVYCAITLEQAAGSSIPVARVFNTSGGATLLYESDGTGFVPTYGADSIWSIYIQSVYTLTAGTPYQFDIQGKDASGTSAGLYCNASGGCPFYMFAEGVGLVSGSSFSGTPGSVIFVGSSGQLTQDNANFYWNDTTFALGLGTIPSSTTLIDMVNNSGASKPIQVTQYGFNSAFRGRYANGTLASPTAATSGSILAAFSGRGYGTSQFAAASTGVLNVVANETFTNTSNATYLQFSVTPTGSVTVAEAMRLNSTGNLLIGTTTDSGTQKLQVNGNSNVGTVTAGVWNGTATTGKNFITSGTTYTTPAGITAATVFDFILVGGGSGGSSPNVAADHGTGGGGGGMCRLVTTGLSPSTAYTITIGSGGAGGTSGTTGAAGGATTLVIGATTYTANGASAPTAVTATFGGAGGTATGGTLNITGQTGGGSSAVATASGGIGGSSPMGFGLGGGPSGTSASGNNGNPGTGYGGGGAGANDNGGGTGGAGTQGIIFVTWSN